MKTLIIFIVAHIVCLTNGEGLLDTLENCVGPDVGSYQNSIFDLGVSTFKVVARQSNVNFVFAPHSIWIMLAAIAEGSDLENQQQLFKILNLPDDSCVRQKYYQIATTRVLRNNVGIDHNRALVVDENININSTWLNFVSNNSLVDVVTAPIRDNPNATTNEIERIIAANVPYLDLTGNSVMLDTFDCNGLWTTAFTDAIIEPSPFYNQKGEQIGNVDLIKMTRRARMGYVKSVNGKVLELPVGEDSEYRMLFFIRLDDENLLTKVDLIPKDLITEMFSSLKESDVPLDIAIPRLEVNGEIDVRALLEKLEVKNLWTDPDATKYISSPSAFPSSYVQRASITLSQKGIATPVLEQNARTGIPTGLDPKVGKDFIANRPLLFGLFDAETLSPVVAAAYSKPV